MPGAPPHEARWRGSTSCVLTPIQPRALRNDRAIEDAFPGARLDVPLPGQEASFGMVFPDHPRRVFEARELSDGTLRYLALAGALLSLRLPSFVALKTLSPALNEPLFTALDVSYTALSTRFIALVITVPGATSI